MKLFLASSIDKTISLLNKEAPLKNLRVLFITNASDTYKNTWWIDLDRKAFMKTGSKIVDVDLRQIRDEEFSDILKKINLVHICGGSVLYLMALLRKNHLDKLLSDTILNNKIIYTGTSAGSMIVSSDLSLSKYDEEETNFIEDMKGNFSGLGLINFFIVPHCQNTEFIESNKKIIGHLPENRLPIILLNDNQAVYVVDDCLNIVSIRNY